MQSASWKLCIQFEYVWTCYCAVCVQRGWLSDFVVASMSEVYILKSVGESPHSGTPVLMVLSLRCCT